MAPPSASGHSDPAHVASPPSTPSLLNVPSASSNGSQTRRSGSTIAGPVSPVSVVEAVSLTLESIVLVPGSDSALAVASSGEVDGSALVELDVEAVSLEDCGSSVVVASVSGTHSPATPPLCSP